jgi:hypothetical protein
MKPSPTTLSIGAIAGLLVTAMLLMPGCGNSSKAGTGAGGTGGGTPGTGGANVVCTVADAACSTNSQCCSGSCDPVTQKCKSSVAGCMGPNSSCAVATDCCNLQCDTTKGVCSTAPSCVADNQSCASSGECCSGNCSGGHCMPLSTTCTTAGNPCSPTDGGGGGCCSGLCSAGKCVLGSSFCIQPGDACARDIDCCGGFCSKASGATLGVCMDVATTGAGQCQHDGVLCNGCGSCCSRNCGPWALTGVNVCQPGLGCKILNSLCTTSAECCGGDTGTVTCNPATGGSLSIGVCAQNHGNQVPGGICRLTGGTNACSNAQSDCECALDPKVACCAYDTLGLPRCLGSGACAGADGGVGVFAGSDQTCCRPSGGTCNTAAECCNLVPCVPDATGTRHCLTSTPNDGGIVCVAPGGTCTATGDCCTGYVCNIAPGAPSGTCGNPPSYDGGTPVCALYGQGCGGATACCNGAVCTYSPTNTVCAGQTGCTCLIPIN